jgi:hypothetical protein
MALEPKRCIEENNQTIISKSINQPKIIAGTKVIPKKTHITNNINRSNFEKLLNSDNFSDAMTFYLEADEIVHENDLKTIEEVKRAIEKYGH